MEKSNIQRVNQVRVKLRNVKTVVPVISDSRFLDYNPHVDTGPP